MREYKIDNRKFAEMTHHNYQKVRRWSREIFGIDPRAGQSQGFAREYTIEQAFLLYLAAHLISDRKVGIQDTKKIIQHVGYWLEEHKFFPLENWEEEAYGSAVIEGQSKSLTGWDITVIFHDNEGICLMAEAHFGSEENVGKFEDFDIKKRYVAYDFFVNNCQGKVVNSITFPVEALIKEFTYFFSIK